MDVRFYPPPQSASDPPCLGPSHCLDPYYCNKFDGENMYMSMTEPSQDCVPASQFRVPDSPTQLQQNMKETGPHWKRDVASQLDYPRLSWSYPVPSLGDEDFNIPPITPPTHPEQALVHMPETETGGYHSLCPPMSHNGLLPFHPQNMDLPAITVSNMLSQDGALCTNPLSVMNGAEKRPATDIGKKPKTPKKKKKKDPNEPQKPVSAYALFFRDTQAAIKGQNANATFGEVSKIVASMWDGLGEEQKQLFKKKTEAAKKEYLKQLAAYRASLVSKSYCESIDVKISQPSQMMTSKQQVFHGPTQTHSGLYMGSPYHQQHGMNPHMNVMHPNLPRSIAPKPNSQMPMTVSMPVSPPPHLQISPPLHQHLSLQQHQSITMQQQLGNHQLPRHSPTMQQGFSLQPEYQNIINSTTTAGQGVSLSMDYVRSGCRNPPAQNVEWNNEYCSNGGLQRDKVLYLT
ncbi:thymocyte selection-associated high mobility group box protein TOX-like isoform X3 [Acipenser ruthenus]|uniref:thymocyte selection-associated high mobility group box protein TOX-like isoform X3 n=1 Tax=Acipenser ruthenus TaxID=7906 RepID=UPI00145BD50B|nr:thymocyte selection-associated high mobility group box protein TOX-like isoform X3 [Acipenser ruthenus]